MRILEQTVKKASRLVHTRRIGTIRARLRTHMLGTMLKRHAYSPHGDSFKAAAPCMEASSGMPVGCEIPPSHPRCRLETSTQTLSARRSTLAADTEPRLCTAEFGTWLGAASTHRPHVSMCMHLPTAAVQRLANADDGLLAQPCVRG